MNRVAFNKVHQAFLRLEKPLDFLRLSSVEQLHFFNLVKHRNILTHLEARKRRTPLPNKQWKKILQKSYPAHVKTVANRLASNGNNDSNSIENSEKFSNSNDYVPMPSLEVELLWRVHCLNPSFYYKDCINLFYQIIPRPTVWDHVQMHKNKKQRKKQKRLKRQRKAQTQIQTQTQNDGIKTANYSSSGSSFVNNATLQDPSGVRLATYKPETVWLLENIDFLINTTINKTSGDDRSSNGNGKGNGNGKHTNGNGDNDIENGDENNDDGNGNGNSNGEEDDDDDEYYVTDELRLAIEELKPEEISFASLNLWSALHRQTKFIAKIVGNITKNYQIMAEKYKPEIDIKLSKKTEDEIANTSHLDILRMEQLRELLPQQQPLIVCNEDIQYQCLQRYLKFLCLLSVQKEYIGYQASANELVDFDVADIHVQDVNMDFTRKNWLDKDKIKQIREIYGPNNEDEYNRFINGKFNIIPAIDVDLFWHSHCLDPKSYHLFSQNLFGMNMMDHNDNIREIISKHNNNGINVDINTTDAQENINRGIEIDVLKFDRECTSKLWQNVYNEEFKFKQAFEFGDIIAIGSNKNDIPNLRDISTTPADRKNNNNQGNKDKDKDSQDEQEIQTTRNGNNNNSKVLVDPYIGSIASPLYVAAGSALYDHYNYHIYNVDGRNENVNGVQVAPALVVEEMFMGGNKNEIDIDTKKDDKGWSWTDEDPDEGDDTVCAACGACG